MPPAEWHCDVCGNTLPYSSTRKRPIGDHSMDPHVSDDEESSSSDECEVNVCAVSDDDVPLAALRQDFQGTSQPQSSVGEHMSEQISFPKSEPQPEASQLISTIAGLHAREQASPIGKCQQEPLKLGNNIEKYMHVKDGASPMRKRRRLSLHGSPRQTRKSSHEENPVVLERETAASSINDLLDSTSMSSSFLLAISDTVLGEAAASDETLDTAAVPVDVDKSCEAILIRESDSECSSDASVELLNINKVPGQSKESKKPRSKATEAFDAVKERSPLRTRKRYLAKLKRLSLDTKVEADSSASVVSEEEGRETSSTESSSLDFKFKQEPFDSDDDSCLITKVVKKPCPYGNDKFGKCTLLLCCNPVEYFCPGVMATSSKATNYKCRDLQITTVSSTRSCDHDQEKSTREHTRLEQTATASEDLCSVGTNTAPLKLSTRKDYPSNQSSIGQYYFPKGKRPVSSSDEPRRLNLRSKKSGSHLERSLKTFSSLCEHHMPVSHKCFR